MHIPAFASMEWNEITPMEGCGGSSDHSTTAPTIKNHSITYFNGFLYCFGGYDGRRNHNALLLYSIQHRRWIRPHHEFTSGVMMTMEEMEENNNNNNNDNNSTGVSDDTDKMEGTTSLFQQQQHDSLSDTSFVVKGTPPAGRNGHSATLAAEDDENGRIIVIGGWLGTGPLAASDTNILDISSGGRVLRWYQPAIKGTPPGPCNMHSADFVAARKEVYVFRGGNGREYLNDLHALHTETLTWRRVETTGEIPQQRANHSSALLEVTGELFIFGGWNGAQRLNDIHILDTATSVWTFPQIGGVLPHPRAGMTLTAMGGRLYLFGGSGTSAKCFQDMQILDRQELAWLDVTKFETEMRQQQQQWGGTSMIFGGSGSDSNTSLAQPNRVYESGQDGVTLEQPMQIQRQQLPPQQYSSSRADWRSRDMVGVPVHRRQAPTFSSPNPNDEDTVPTVLVKGAGPKQRAGHTATAINRKLLIFGGSCGTEYLNDFHVLDTDPPPHTIVTEPNTLQLFERRLRHFCNDEEFSDVTFLVDGKKVYGHKMVLSIVSDCFRAMFTTGFRESEQMEIEIPDCSYAAFLAFMEYIYTGALPHLDTQMQNSRIRNVERVVEMLELADRFMLDHLKQVCEQILQPAVNMESVEYFVAVAQKTNATQLQAICEHLSRNREML